MTGRRGASAVVAALAALALVASACGKSGGTGETKIFSSIGKGEGQLNLIAWPGYVESGQNDPKFDWVTPFEKQSGCQVNVKYADTSPQMVTLMRQSGGTIYDGVSASGNATNLLIAHGDVAGIDVNKIIPNYDQMLPSLRAPAHNTVDGVHYGVPYMYGPDFLMFNTDVVTTRPDSWDVVFKPEQLAKFKDCGVHFLDSSDDIMSGALHYLGLDPNSKREADYQKATDLLTRVRPAVRKFHSSEYISALATGEICFVVGFSGDIKQSQKRATEAKNGIEIAYAIPKEGAQLWFDNVAIPRDARNIAEAHEFINFLQQPEVAAKNSNFVAYANGNLASQKFINKDVLEDRTIYPDEATMARFYTMRAHDAATTRLMNRLWTRIKTGR